MEIEKLHSFMFQTDHCQECIFPIWFLQFELMPEREYWIRDIFLGHLHREWEILILIPIPAGFQLSSPFS